MPDKDERIIAGNVDVSEAFKENIDETMAAEKKDEAVVEKAIAPEPKAEPVVQAKAPKHGKQSSRGALLSAYDVHYKKLLLIPLIITVVCIGILLMSYSQTGAFFKTDVSIRGGVSISVLTDSNPPGLEQVLSDAVATAVSVRTLSEAGSVKGLIIEAGITDEEAVAHLSTLIEQQTGASDLTVQVVGSSLGASFYSSVVKSMIAAFLLMGLVVFFYFRIMTGKWFLPPSLFIVWTAFVDIICTFAVVSLLDMELSIAGLAAFLLLIGYSVDTDILLTLRVLKGKEPLFERITGAARTGIFLTLTAMAAVIAGAFFSQSDVIRQIMIIMTIGLAFDLLHTWLTNAGILRWFIERNTYGGR
jgi:preprotein translocase subunit SecF